MMHQLDLFGGEPVKLAGKAVQPPKKKSRSSMEKNAAIENEDLPAIAEEPISSLYLQPDLFSSIEVPEPIEKALSSAIITKTSNTVEKDKPAAVVDKLISEAPFKDADPSPPIISPSIPADDILFSKQYYPISEVAGMFGVNISLLRYWEKEFDIIKPRKNRKGDRLFRPADIKNLKIIFHLLKEKKYTIKGAKDFLKKGNKVTEKFEAVEVLKNIRTMLVELKSALT
jgi:DNA-binding transcriptional MerR regulator